MRRITSFLFIFSCLLVFVVPVFADDCSDALNEAKNLYNAGNYSKAKELFDYVASECGANYGDATAWSKKCKYAVINDITVDHNVYQNGQKGMRIHVKFDAYNVLNHSVKVCVYFHYSDGGNALKGIRGSGYCTSDGSVTVQSASKATYTNTTWSDFTLFMPYQKLNMQAGCKDVSLEGRVGILDNTTDKWLTTKHKKFSFTFSN
ncbi:MAG: hypothetical protein ACI4BD_05025 [Paludibacteraceae bacterium]